MKKDLKFGKINLTAFHDSSLETVRGKRGVFIPLEDNHLSENYKDQVYADLVSFSTPKLLPWTHNIVLSVPEQFRKEKWVLGGFKLE